MQKQNVAGCLDPFIEHCKKFDLKITPQRCAIYRELARAKNHPTADEMFTIVKKEFPNISYDTVNRTLLTFAEIGLVDVVSTKGGPRRFDPDMDSHHHFHCIQCGEILDFYSDEFDNLEITQSLPNDFTVYSKRIVLNGLCKNCQRKKSSKIATMRLAIKNKKNRSIK
jgi:Fur family peroxide stress response transcriptional regulator